jgi:hypothetical protein
MQFGKARADADKSFILAVEEPELHIQPSQQKRLVNRLNALCDQTIVTTHSPIVAAMFPPPDTLFLESRTGTLNTRPLMGTVPIQPTNHQQHLLYAWREKFIAALMHEAVLIPEGVSDVAWLEALQASLELHQSWDADDASQSRFSTFVGVVPTYEAKVADTFVVVSRVHTHPCILLDGDDAGRGYFDSLKTSNPPPRGVVFWPKDWAMENVVAWIACADEGRMLAELGATLETAFANAQALTEYLLTKKSYAPTHETVAVTLMSNKACQTRAANLLDALCDVLREPSSANTQLFTRIQSDSTAIIHVFQFSPP